MESIQSMHLKIRRTAMAVARMTITATRTAMTATYGVSDFCVDPRKHKINWEKKKEREREREIAIDRYYILF